MLNTNAKIEQLIHTACGKYGQGEFGVWSASSDELKDTSSNKEIINIMDAIYKGNIDFRGNIDSSFNQQRTYERVLKAGATPSGLFRKSYKDSDYETVEVITRNEIITVEESQSSGLRKHSGLRDQIGYDDDFRGNEDKAPYRIAYTKLLDGRLLLCRVSAIGTVYSTQDARQGNRLYHGYLFPSGTKITDIDLSKINFVKGIDKKYWSGTPVVAPEYLPKLTIDDLYNHSNNATKKPVSKTQSDLQKKTENNQPKNLKSTEELMELFKKSELSKDYALRRSSRGEFANQVRMGACIPELINSLYEKFIKTINAGQEISDEDESIANSLSIVNTPFSFAFEHARRYYELKNEKKTEDYVNKVSINVELQYIDGFLCSLDSEKLERLKKEAEFTKKYIENRKKFEYLIKNKTLPKCISLDKDEKIKYYAADYLFVLANNKIKEKTTSKEIIK